MNTALEISERQAKSLSVWGIVFIGFAVLLVVWSAWLQIELRSVADKGWLLYAAQRWMKGDKLYVNIMEVNPPLILWLYGGVIKLTQWLPPLKDYQLLAMFGLFFSSLSAMLGARLIRLHPEFSTARRQGEFFLLLEFIFIFFTATYFFFDRDDILFVLTFPYMLRFMPTLAREKMPLWLSSVIGFLAAVGFCIKPHTIIIFAALQLIYLTHVGSFRILWSRENLIIYAGGLIYFFCIWHFAPDYIRVIIPMALATYSSFGDNGGNKNLYLLICIAFVVLIFGAFNFRQATPYRREVYYFLSVCLAFLAYGVANNGWSYTYNPLICLLLFLAIWVLWEYQWIKREKRAQGLPVWRSWCGIACCQLLLWLNVAFMIWDFGSMQLAVYSAHTSCRSDEHCWWRTRDYVPPHDYHIRSFGTLAFDFHYFVLLQQLTGAEWVTRYNSLWILPKFFKSDRNFLDAHYWIVDKVGRGLADDLDSKQPEVVFVSQAYNGTIEQNNIIAILSMVPQFKEAWSHYYYATSVGKCDDSVVEECNYDIYARGP